MRKMILPSLIVLMLVSFVSQIAQAAPVEDKDGWKLKDVSRVSKESKAGNVHRRSAVHQYELTAEEKRYAADVKRYRALNEQYQRELRSRAICLAQSAVPERCSVPNPPLGPGDMPLRPVNGRLADLR